MPNRAPDPDEGSDLEELEEDDEGASLARLRELARAPDAPGARDELLSALQEPSEVWRLTALQGLARREAPADLAPLAASLLGAASDPFLQAEARLVLARAGEADVVDLARRALGRRGLPEASRWPVRPALARRVGLGWPLRRLGARALGHAGPADASIARAALRGVLTDPDWAVREAAAEALGALGPGDEDRRALEAALRDRRGAVRRAAARALGRDPGAPIEDAWDAWRAGGAEPHYRYLGVGGRRDYREDLVKATRDGPGANWAPFGVDPEADDPPDDVDPAHPLVRALAIPRDDALTRARDLIHHPGVAWPVDPVWPVCCNDYAVFHGHALEPLLPRGEDLEDWFLEALEPDLPFPEEGLDELEAETYAFRCGFCGWWWTSYRE
ncbi:MAG: CbrC family protein [Planctomycetes bacterium]|nr:CbrC family protein [Planctomycetota bacterium]